VADKLWKHGILNKRLSDHLPISLVIEVINQFLLHLLYLDMID